MKAVIYARYSSDNQTEASIEGQLRECMEYAERTRIDVIGNYIDRALTAKTDNRPEFQRMIKDSYKHAFDIIIVWKLDRFSRNRYDSAYYKALLKKNGVKVVSAKETIAEGSEGILLEAVLEGYAEFYSAELSEKVVRGMTENVLKGRNNGGQVTFGYEIDDDMYFHPHPTTAPIVEEIFTMYDDGKTIKQIVDYLEEKNIKTIRGGKMTINIVQRMLSNRRYIGEYKFRDTVIPDGIPALVNKDLFERVQQKLAKNKKAPARRKAEDDYLLTLKLFCGKCGAHMFGESGMGTSKVYRYYKCAKTKKVHLCDKKPVRKEWMEDLAVKKALEILNNEDLISVLVERIYALQGEENPRIPRLKEQLADIEKRIGNIMSAIEQGIITDTTKDRLSQLETQKKEIEITLLQERIKKPFLTKEQIQFGIERYKKLDLSTLEGKRRLIEAFINAIYVYDDKIVFTFNYKDGTQTVSMSELTTMTATGDNSDMNCIGAPRGTRTPNTSLRRRMLYPIELAEQGAAITAAFSHLSFFPQVEQHVGKGCELLGRKGFAPRLFGHVCRIQRRLRLFARQRKGVHEVVFQRLAAGEEGGAHRVAVALGVGYGNAVLFKIQFHHRAVHVWHGLEHSARHILYDLRACHAGDGRRNGAVIRRPRLRAKAARHVVLHHDEEGTHPFRFLHKPHDERGGDIVGQVCHHRIFAQFFFQGGQIFPHEIAENHFRVVHARQRFRKHGLQFFVDLVGDHPLCRRGKLACQRSRAAADF